MFKSHDKRVLIGSIVVLLLSACTPAASPVSSQPAGSQNSTRMPSQAVITASPGTQAMAPAPGTETPAVTLSSPAPAVPTSEDTATYAVPTLAPVTSKELNVFAKPGAIPQQLIDNFARDNNVSVKYDTYTSSSQFLSRLQTGASGYDVVIADDYSIQLSIKQDLLDPIDHNQIPNLANIDPQFLNQEYDLKNKFSIPYQWGTVGLAVNTIKVAHPVSSWVGLWDPALKNRVVLLDDEREDIGMALLVLGYDKNSTDPAQLDQARQLLLQLLPNVQQFTNDNASSALLSGDAWIGQTWSGEAVLAHRQNPAIQYTCPKEGCGIWFDNMAIPKGAEHKDAAQAFLNFVLRPEESVLITKESPFSNPNQAALVYLQQTDPAAYQAYMDFSATNPPADDIKNGHPVRDVGDAATLWDQIWTEVKAK